MQSIVKDTVEIRFQVGNVDGNRSAFNITAITPNNISLNTSGKKISFVLKFLGEQDAVIYNPLFYLKVELLDQDKKPLLLKQKPSVLLLNLNRPIDPEEDFTFKIKKAQQNGKLQDLSVLVNEPFINFKSNSSYCYTLELDLLSEAMKGQGLEDAACYILISGNLMNYTAKDKTKSSNPFKTQPIPLKH